MAHLPLSFAKLCLLLCKVRHFIIRQLLPSVYEDNLDRNEIEGGIQAWRYGNTQLFPPCTFGASLPLCSAWSHASCSSKACTRTHNMLELTLLHTQHFGLQCPRPSVEKWTYSDVVRDSVFSMALATCKDKSGHKQKQLPCHPSQHLEVESPMEWSGQHQDRVELSQY